MTDFEKAEAAMKRLEQAYSDIKIALIYIEPGPQYDKIKQASDHILEEAYNLRQEYNIKG